jgi:hypothetical protein
MDRFPHRIRAKRTGKTKEESVSDGDIVPMQIPGQKRHRRPVGSIGGYPRTKMNLERCCIGSC